MAENKTRATGASVEGHIAARASAQQQADCQALIAMLGRITGQPPAMWGPSIVGFGAYRYTHDSGRGGDAPLAAFAIRGRDLVIYVDVEGEAQQALLSRLGKHRMGKVCLYVRQLADIDAALLEQLVAQSVAAARRRHG